MRNRQSEARGHINHKQSDDHIEQEHQPYGTHLKQSARQGGRHCAATQCHGEKQTTRGYSHAYTHQYFGYHRQGGKCLHQAHKDIGIGTEEHAEKE